MTNYLKIDNLTSHLETAQDDMKPFATSIASVFKDSFSGNTDGMITFFEDTMNKVYSEMKVGSPEAQAILSENMAKFIYDAMMSQGNFTAAEDFINRFMERQVGVIANKAINGSITSDTPEADVSKKVKEAIKGAISAMQKSSNEFANRWANMGKDAREKFIKELEKSGNGVADSIRKILSWQGRAKKFGLSVYPKIDVDYTDFIENKRKLINET